MTYENKTRLPSVTQIINPYINTDYFTEEHSERGTSVHSACIAFILGLFVPPLPPEYKPYFESFKRWSDRIDIILLAEERLIDPVLKFTGKPDLICTMKIEHGFNSETVLIDLKTSQAEAKWWAIQNAAYRHLAAKRSEPIPTQRGMSLRLKNDGSGCLVNEYPRDYRGHFNVFLGLLNAFNYFNK